MIKNISKSKNLMKAECQLIVDVNMQRKLEINQKIEKFDS